MIYIVLCIKYKWGGDVTPAFAIMLYPTIGNF